MCSARAGLSQPRSLPCDVNSPFQQHTPQVPLPAVFPGHRSKLSCQKIYVNISIEMPNLTCGPLQQLITVHMRLVHVCQLAQYTSLSMLPRLAVPRTMAQCTSTVVWCQRLEGHMTTPPLQILPPFMLHLLILTGRLLLKMLLSCSLPR